MGPRVTRNLFSVEPSEGWHHQLDPECLTLTVSPEGGAFQLSAARKAAAPIALREVLEMASEEVNVTGTPVPVAFGAFTGFSVSYQRENSLRRRFWLAQGHLLVFATYNGSADVGAAEEPAVEAMLATLRPENGAA
jgi:hypothetical protein